jgi:hypothetical protein
MREMMRHRKTRMKERELFRMKERMERPFEGDEGEE